MTNGLVNAMVEVGGGGIDTLPAELRSGNASAIRVWVNSMLDEGKEEIVQGVLERGLQNLAYQKGNPIVSLDDPNAVFNPKTMAEEGVAGAFVGGLLSGGQVAVNSTIQNRVQRDGTSSFGGALGATAQSAPGSTAGKRGLLGTVKATANEISNYIERALSRSRFIPGAVVSDVQYPDLPIADVSPELALKIFAEYGVDISGGQHILRDNNLRHIYNRHGPHTNETDPVIAADLKMIPTIINDAAEVYYVPRKDGKRGLIYEYHYDANATYYLEQIIDGGRLVNAQMIKTPTGVVPELPGLHEAIKNKRSTSAAPGAVAGNAASPQMYVQDVWRDASNPNLAQHRARVNSEAFADEKPGIYTAFLQREAEDAQTDSSVTEGQQDAMDRMLYTEELLKDGAKEGSGIYGEALRKAEREKARKIADESGLIDSVPDDAEIYADFIRRHENGISRQNSESEIGRKEFEKEWVSADTEAMEFFKADARDKLDEIVARETTKIKQGISAFAKEDVLFKRVARVKPDGDMFDVAMHGSERAVAFGGIKPNMSPRLLASVIRHSEDYHGQDIRLLSCNTGRVINGEYCFAEELANALGVTVYAPNDLIVFNNDGTFEIGRYNQGSFIPYEPNKRRRLK